MSGITLRAVDPAVALAYAVGIMPVVVVRTVGYKRSRVQIEITVVCIRARQVSDYAASYLVSFLKCSGVPSLVYRISCVSRPLHT